MIAKLTIEPRYQETDQMGIIHHSVYPIWYEMGRVQFCEAIGIPFHVIEEKGIRLAMYNMSCRYIKPTVFGQKYTLEVRLIQLSKVRLVFQYQLFDHQYTMVHEGQTELIWLNHDLKPTNVYKTHPDIYERFLAEVTL